MRNASPLMFDDDQYIEQPRRCCHDATEVTGQYRRGVVVTKGRPALIATGFPHGGVRMWFRTVRGDTRIASLSSNWLATRSSPPDWIIYSHLMNQSPEFSR